VEAAETGEETCFFLDTAIAVATPPPTTAPTAKMAARTSVVPGMSGGAEMCSQKGKVFEDWDFFVAG